MMNILERDMKPASRTAQIDSQATPGARPKRAPSKYLVPMVEHVLRILEAFAASEIELTLKEVSARSGVGSTSTFRILYTLAERNYVVKNLETGKYRLGLKMTQAAWPRGPVNLTAAARPYLEKLWKEFNETVNLAVLEDAQIVYVEMLESSRPFRMTASVGSTVPLNATALGKAMGAFLAEEELDRLMQTCTWNRYTPHTIVSKAKWRATLEQVRRNGYAYDDEEAEAGASCIAVPVLNQEQRAIAGISISAPTGRIRTSRKLIIQKLRQAATEMSPWL
jgi:IclR family KDG regulon transcriptional repressor